jgi:hypothetical protein
MKRFTRQSDTVKVVSLKYGLSFYGKVNDMYRIELGITILHEVVVVPLYKSTKRPKFRWLPVINLLAIIVQILAHIFTGVMWIAFLLFHFHFQCLFRRSFITGKMEAVSGWVSLALMLTGIYFLMRMIF